jgi:hypothetical protein
MPDGNKIDQCPQNVPISSIARPSKIYPNCYFWFENKPSGNPDFNVLGGWFFKQRAPGLRIRNFKSQWPML